ncbi:MAG: molecular chaperone TorD family protein [Candidatus Bipolaricaulota bacterium]
MDLAQDIQDSPDRKFFSARKEVKKWRPVLLKLAWMGFSYPEGTLVKKVSDGTFFAGLREVERAYGLDIGEGRVTLENKPVEALRKKLETDYVSLFIAEVGGASVQPYGSYYIDGSIMGASTDQVVNRYSEAGFIKDQDYTDLPDHIAVELEYLFKLHQMDGTERYHRHVQFFDELVKPWLGEFTDAVVEESNSGFYAALARWMEAGLNKDREVLGKLLNADDSQAKEVIRKND